MSTQPIHAESAKSAKQPNRQAVLFIIVTAFLSSMGIGLISPVAPFLVARYVGDSSSAGVTLGLLTSIYAICQFVAAPGLGVLSDRFGRRPILLICLFGSAIGYLLLGIGGALWVLFLGRIIDGITGGNYSVSFAYIADVTPPEERAKYFGRVGAIAGIGIIAGPIIGGLLAKFGIEAPFYGAAALTFANIIFGLFFMPESLTKAQRTRSVTLAGLNPFSLLREVFMIRQLRWLLMATFLYSVPFAVVASNLGLLVRDSLGWDATAIGSIFALVGVTDIVVQGVLLERLFKRFSESQVAIGGLCCEVVGYMLIASIVVLPSPLSLLMGTVIFAMGDGLLGPSLSSLMSRAAGTQSQGQVQGGSQSVQALARVVGPLAGGGLYDSAGHAAPYLGGVVMTLLAIGAALLAQPSVKQPKTTEVYGD